jgi:dihydropyrimidine dehydrogenase (NAD+) subunit PreT
VETTVPDIQPNRLGKAEIDENFADLHPPLSRSEALIEADRCYFCFDAPCTTACPTGIDIPAFIQKIRSDNIRGSAKTILSENIMGGMCARVCPTEVLCEEACVRNTHEDKPVEIGLLQRYATDPILDSGAQLFERAESSGKRVAVVGGGPAGLSCAHRLAMLGHDVKIFNRDPLPGGLNEYGIAAYKTVDDFAQREVAWILSIGGIAVEGGVELGKDFSMAALRDAYDAVFLGVGLSLVNDLNIDNEDLPGVENAIDYIADLRQAEDKSALPVGRNVVVIGGGMTAIDIAVQSKRLGAEKVDIVYRRGPDDMSASEFEQHLAQINGVAVHHWLHPKAVHGADHVASIEFDKNGQPVTMEADVVFKAIGQRLADQQLADELKGIDIEYGKIVVDEQQATSLPGVWAGGDCVAGGEDLTVSAVQHGKVAAHAIDRYLGGDNG